MGNNIFILTGAVRSGKTTSLRNWAEKKSLKGFITPDEEGGRKLYSFSEDRFYEMQVNEKDDCEKIKVGRFLFRKDAFDRAKELINSATGDNIFIIDEAGPLEILYDQGFEPELCRLIEKFKNNISSGKLIIVIRENLLEQAKKKYGLADEMIIRSVSEI